MFDSEHEKMPNRSGEVETIKASKLLIRLCIYQASSIGQRLRYKDWSQAPVLSKVSVILDHHAV